MAHTYHLIYIQAVFAVKYRAAVIDECWQDQLFTMIGNLINETGCQSMIVNGVIDHVHCFFGLRPAVSVSDVMKAVKAKSSKWINENKLTTERFEWQTGYSVFSYSKSHAPLVHRYIQQQAKHHQQMTFQEEHLNMLNKFEIPYDERFLFHEPI